jgi:hypothetical protein
MNYKGIVSIYVFEIKKNCKWKAFTKMATMPTDLAKVEGATFYKMMGSGHGAGFSIRPNFGVYALLIAWQDDSYISKFEKTFHPFLKYLQLVESIKKIYALPYKFHGTWDKKQPFTVTDLHPPSSKRLVITRATIKLSKLIPFWTHVPKTSDAIENAEGRQFSVGVGEWPWIQQATISIWDSEEAMKRYAYQNIAHLEAIKKTKDLAWYAEEMFTRFYVLDAYTPA